jgi:hypothetical protein
MIDMTVTSQTKTETPDAVRAYLGRIGKIGGSAGRGKAKARTKTQARAAAAKRWAKYRAAKAAQAAS